MKKFVKIVSLALAILMIAAAFAACGKKDDDKGNKGPTTVTPGGDDNSIEVIYWDNTEYRILGKDSTSYEWAKHFEVFREELPEDTVGKAVWERNLHIRDTYGINVKGYLKTDCNEVANTTLESGEDEYDLMLLAPEKFQPLATKGFFLDLYKLDYINMEHEAWMEVPNEQLSMGGRLYYTTNKFLIQDKNRSWLFYYNRDLAKELNLGYFEDWVFDGTWTVDKVIEIGKQATYDSDGEPGMGKKDNWGVAVAEFYSFAQIAYGTGFSYTQKAVDDYPEFIADSADMMRRLDKVYELTANKEVYYCDQSYGSVNYSDCAYHMFYAKKVLMHPSVVSHMDTLGIYCDFVYAPLPNPKFEEKQEMYYALPNLGNGSLLGVPSTVMDPSFAGYALEVISETSVKTTYNKYIEDKCLLQNVVDQDAANCLRLVFEGITYDIAFISDIGGYGIMMRNELGSYSSNTFKRLFSSKLDVAKGVLEDIKTAYAALPY